MVVDANAEATKHTIVDMHEPGGVCLAVKAVPAPTEETTSVELVGAAERAVAAEPKALESWAGDKAGCGDRKSVV